MCKWNCDMYQRYTLNSDEYLCIERTNTFSRLKQPLFSGPFKTSLSTDNIKWSQFSFYNSHGTPRLTNIRAAVHTITLYVHVQVRMHE